MVRTIFFAEDILKVRFMPGLSESLKQNFHSQKQ